MQHLHMIGSLGHRLGGKKNMSGMLNCRLERCEGEGLESVRPGDDMIWYDVICYGTVLCAMET